MASYDDMEITGDPKTRQLTKINKAERSCFFCKKGIIIADAETGELICNNCGFVLIERIEDLGPERVPSNDDVRNARSGSHYSLAKHDMGLATIIGTVDKDAFGRPLSAPMKYAIERLRKWDSRSQTDTMYSKNLRIAFTLLDRLKDSLGLSYVILEQAAYIYRKAVDKGLTRGRSISGILGASLYAACRYTETPRSLKDISKEINVNKKMMAACYRLILRELDLKMPIADPTKCVARIASKTNINEKTKRKALEIIQRATEFNIVVGKDPLGFAASALYLSCMMNGNKITQKNIAGASGVTEVTVRNRYKELRTRLFQDDMSFEDDSAQTFRI